VRPLLKAFAVVGTGGLVGMLVSAVSRFSGMHIASFKTRGKQWTGLSNSRQASVPRAIEDRQSQPQLELLVSAIVDHRLAGF